MRRGQWGNGKQILPSHNVIRSPLTTGRSTDWAFLWRYSCCRRRCKLAAQHSKRPRDTSATVFVDLLNPCSHISNAKSQQKQHIPHKGTRTRKFRFFHMFADLPACVWSQNVWEITWPERTMSFSASLFFSLFPLRSQIHSTPCKLTSDTSFGLHNRLFCMPSISNHLPPSQNWDGPSYFRLITVFSKWFNSHMTPPLEKTFSDVCRQTGNQKCTTSSHQLFIFFAVMPSWRSEDQLQPHNKAIYRLPSKKVRHPGWTQRCQ